MKTYKAVVREGGRNGIVRVMDIEGTKREVQETLKGNGLRAIAILSEKQIEKASNDITNVHYDLVSELRGNGLI